MVVGSVVVYAFGATWLAVDLNVSAAKAFDLGVSPFLVTDAIKTLIAALVFPTAWRLARRPQD